jgi:hypothetical protein
MNLKDKIYFGEPIRDRFYNGYSEDETVVLRYDGKTGWITIRNLFKLVKPAERLVAKEEDIWLKKVDEDMQVLGRNGFERVYEIIRRVVYEPLLVIETETKKTTVSASHQIPVKRDGKDILARADELKEGDIVFVIEDDGATKEEKIIKVYKDKKERLSVYGMVTETGGAAISRIFQKSY